MISNVSCLSVTCVKPQFAICSSGFKSGSLVHLNYYLHKVDMPSLQIYGETDNIIPKEMSQALAETFASPEIIKHPGGHYFPATSKEKQTYINFFQDRLQEYLEAKEIENSNKTNSLLVNDDNDESSSE
jgi:pimeloyl-ACP methyl ester carboxylesterase